MGTPKYAEKADPAVTVLLDQAHQTQEEYRDILDRRSILRDSLRSFVAGGKATKEQAADIEELYPPRGNSNAAKAA